jgi:hypothetical protein
VKQCSEFGVFLFAAAFLFYASSCAQAQTTRRLGFSVSSVKPNKSDVGPPSITFPTGTNRFIATNVTARMLIVAAYEVDYVQISGGPNWFNSDRFDVEAQTDEGTPVALD